eukprot:scaffold317249_cov32-Tisochrysis_lutea.AAC.3
MATNYVEAQAIATKSEQRIDKQRSGGRKRHCHLAVAASQNYERRTGTHGEPICHKPASSDLVAQ